MSLMTFGGVTANLVVCKWDDSLVEILKITKRQYFERAFQIGGACSAYISEQDFETLVNTYGLEHTQNWASIGWNINLYQDIIDDVIGLSADEARGVVYHEYGHIYHKHFGKENLEHVVELETGQRVLCKQAFEFEADDFASLHGYGTHLKNALSKISAIYQAALNVPNFPETEIEATKKFIADIAERTARLP